MSNRIPRRFLSFSIALVATAFIAGLLPTSRAQAFSFGGNACYELGTSGEYIRYIARPLGLLSGFKDKREWGHALQTVYAVHGKATFAVPEGPPGQNNLMGHINGTITVEKYDDAALSFQTDFFAPSTVFIKRMCWSSESSPTPEQWTCRGILVRTFGSGNNEVIPSPPGEQTLTLNRRDPLLVESCSLHITPDDIVE